MTFPQNAGAQKAPPTSAVEDLGRARPDADEAIRELVVRLSRAHPSGGTVIERAAILASGADLEAVMTWIAGHAGQPEATAAATPDRGLHA